MALKKQKQPIVLILSLLFIILLLCSGCVTLTCAFVKDSAITNGWYENTSLRNTGTQFLGLEKWCSSSYEINGKYPASLTVTTLKALLLTDEKEIQKNARQLIEETFTNTIQLTENSSGERTIQANHKSRYIIYDGLDIIKEENVKIISEIWNCANSGTSVVCIGISYITNKKIPDTVNMENWQKIVMDSKGSIEHSVGEEGLIDNINCH